MYFQVYINMEEKELDEKHYTLHRPSPREKIFGIRVFSIFASILFLEIPLILSMQWLVDRIKQPDLWRLIAHHNCRIFLRLWGVKLKTLYKPDVTSPVIYASNHPSFVDGLIIFTILGPNSIAVTAPLTSFPFPLGYWFRHMGFVDIQRDDNDAINHHSANPKDMAFKKLLTYLASGRSIFVFPEGHVERDHHLHYVHSGVARLSLQAKVPVQMMSIVGIEKVFLGHGALQPGVITVRFGKMMEPPALSVYLPFRKVVKPFARDIERQLVAILPVRYLPDYYNLKPEGIGAFIDIDRTLYNGYAQKDLVRYLLKRKLLPANLPLKALYWMTLEKVHFISHRQLMKYALSGLRGLGAKQFDRMCTQFFSEVAVKKINHKLLPLIKDHHVKGHVIIIVTEVMHPLARLFKEYIQAATSLDTVLVQKHGHYTGDVELLNYGYTKSEQVEEFARLFNIDLKKSYAYADASSDLPLLYTCRHKIPVNPDKHLRKIAWQLHWQTL